MKNIIIIISFVLPISILAQTKPMPKKSNNIKNIDQVFVIQMDVKEISNKKSTPKFEFNFDRAEFSDKLNNAISKLNLTTVIQVLNYLEVKGWELVSVDENIYFFRKGAKKKL